MAALGDEAILKVVAHESQEDYSSWLLPAVRECLEGSGLQMELVDAYAAAAGPGSFTGVRVGLTTVKAWAEVYGKRVVAVSRLEALATEASEGTAWVAAFVNALVLVGVAVYICIEGYQRIVHPQTVAARTMMLVGLLALLTNGGITVVLSQERRDLNLRAVFIHNLGDALSNAGIIVGGFPEVLL